jgi:hypothetical protein
MSVERTPNDPAARAPGSQPNRAQLADYLEAQADELDKLQTAMPNDGRLVAELAMRFAEVARAHGLAFIAERFDRFQRPAATGTHGS